MTSVLDASFIRVRAPQPWSRLANCTGSASPGHSDSPASFSARNPSVRTKRLR